MSGLYHGDEKASRGVPFRQLGSTFELGPTKVVVDSRQLLNIESVEGKGVGGHGRGFGLEVFSLRHAPRILRPVQELIAERAALMPAALAVASSGESLTYAELLERANRLAWHLLSLGVGPEVPVAILAERSVEMIVALLAVLEAGGCFLPLDPAYPEDRLALTLADSGAAVLLAQDRWLAAAPSLAGAGPKVVRLKADWPEVERCCSSAPPSSASLENLAYIIYTSGSTGRPKGVAVDHRGLAHLTDWYL
ncbi:MAG TPA: AMP-binding protein, partial [Thermoanaerobaculia bacterium]